jgi:hypothetical protein
MANPTTNAARPGTGKEVNGTDSIPQGGVQPGAGPLEAHGPQDWDDVVTHTGEARVAADTARSTLRGDAPTAAAAREGHEIEEDAGIGNEIPSSGNAPD